MNTTTHSLTMTVHGRTNNPKHRKTSGKMLRARLLRAVLQAQLFDTGPCDVTAEEVLMDWGTAERADALVGG
ncbi:MAG TPA: hypothetical protein VFN67_33770 [Polyangiales bacterium]|nr:hypothetical protein [Polyangiales bacterium]